MIKHNPKIDTKAMGINLIREITEKGYPFTWTLMYFTYKGRLYRAGYKDARCNLHDFEDIDTAILVYNEGDCRWCHLVSNAYVSAVGGRKFDGKSIDDDVITDYFDACYHSVEELISGLAR